MKANEPTDAQRAAAAAEIERLIANPPTHHPSDPGKRWPESERANLIGSKALQAIRELACKQTGLTMAQLLEAEANVSHPREFITSVPSERALARRRMMKAGVPELFIASVADKAPLECEPIKYIREFLDSRDGFRVLSGGKGTRKTGSACWALGQLDGGAFVHSRDLTRLSIEQRDKWDAINQAPLVVLDDLGTERRDDKGAFNAAVSELIDRAYSSRRRLVLTCNLTKDTFKAVYGEREFDRMREVGKWSVIGGVSVRQYEPAKNWTEPREPGEEG